MKKIEYYEVQNLNETPFKVYGSFEHQDEAKKFAEYLNHKENTNFRSIYYATKVTREVFESFEEKLAYDAYKRSKQTNTNDTELADD